MTALRIILLLVGVFAAVTRPARLPAWVVPAAAVAAELATGATTLPAIRSAVGPLWAPVGFLLAAVPLAVLLDRLGFFAGLAALFTRGGRGLGGLWVLAALVITALNLDAGVVLLTPLYVGIARARRDDALLFAFPPVLLACLASSALPVSNLTNLIAASHTGAGSVDFLSHLGPPSLAAVGVGWICFRPLARRGLRSGSSDRPGSAPGPAVGGGGEGGSGGVLPAAGSATPPPPRSPAARGLSPVPHRPLLIGGAVMAVVLVGFVGGGTIGVAPWMVALGADAVLVAIGIIRPPGGRPGEPLPWRAVPVGVAAVVLALAVLADAAVSHLGVARLVSGSSLPDLARTAALSAAAANVFNNLPALLVALPAVGRHPTPALWSVLVGVNMGPVLLVTGSLASLLWLETLRRLRVVVGAGDFFRVGLRAGLPGAAAGLAVSLGLRALGWA